MLTILTADASGQCTFVRSEFAGQDIKQMCVLNSAGNSYVIVIEQKHEVTWSGVVGTDLYKVSAGGECSGAEGIFSSPTKCLPTFYHPPYAKDNGRIFAADYENKTYQNSACNTGPRLTAEFRSSACPGPGGACNGPADFTQYPTTGCSSSFVYNGTTCTRSPGFQTQCNRFGGYEYESCSCSADRAGLFPAAILIELTGNGFLTDAAPRRLTCRRRAG